MNTPDGDAQVAVFFIRMKGDFFCWSDLEGEPRNGEFRGYSEFRGQFTYFEFPNSRIPEFRGQFTYFQEII
jgi:hypothetical protein